MVAAELPPLMKSGLFGPIRILSPERRKREGIREFGKADHTWG
jgi:hypothetical protein